MHTWMEVCISRTMVARCGVIVTDLVGRVVIWTVEVGMSAIFYGIFFWFCLLGMVWVVRDWANTSFK